MQTNIDNKLWEHQRKFLLHMKEGWNYHALLWDPGTGKTRALIEALRLQYKQVRRVLPTLILAPVIVLENWKQEFLKFSKIPEERILVLNGPTRQRIDEIMCAKTKFGHQAIFITNYEALAVSQDFFEVIRKWEPEILVCDESQRIKTHNSKRTKVVTVLSDIAKKKFLLTGTPILNSPMDIFAQYRVLDGGIRFGKNYYFFRSKYFYDKNSGMPKDKYFPNWVIRQESYGNLHQKIYTCASRIVKSECLDLPPLIKKKVSVNLNVTQKKMYDDMKRDFIAFLDDKACTAQLAMTKGLRLLQIVTGFAKHDDGSTTRIESPRKEALRELLQEIAFGNKVLVWCVFKENYMQVADVCEDLGLKYVQITGEIADKDKFENVQKFNNEEDIRVLIGHPAAGGVGINLIAASYSIYFSRNFSLENDIQSEARNYRGGSEIHEKITRIDLVCKDTIDELVLEALERKENISEKILQWKKV